MEFNIVAPRFMLVGGGTAVSFGGAGALSRRNTRIDGGSWSLALVSSAPGGGRRQAGGTRLRSASTSSRSTCSPAAPPSGK